METPKFTGRNVPITEIAKATGKSQQFIRMKCTLPALFWD